MNNINFFASRLLRNIKEAAELNQRLVVLVQSTVWNNTVLRHRLLLAELLRSTMTLIYQTAARQTCAHFHGPGLYL